jgi:hypothetical protein
MDYAKLRELKAKKKKYYSKKKSKGEILYGMGGESRTMNTVEDRGKRQYGFKRTTVQQKHRLPLYLIDFRKKKGVRCYKHMGYIYTSTLNKKHKDKDINGLLSLLYTSYQEPLSLIEDYKFGFRDPIFARIVSLTGIMKDDSRLDLFISNYDELLIDTLLKFISKLDNYIASKRITFYSYAANVIPYRFMSQFLPLLNDKLDLMEMDEFVDESYSIEFEYNPLGLHLLNNFREIR